MRASNRVKVVQLVRANTKYDVEKYLELLFTVAENLLLPFGYSARRIRDYVLHRQEQIMLNYKSA